MANALKEIEHAQRLCDRGDITIGEYFDLVEKWEDAEPTKHGRWLYREEHFAFEKEPRITAGCSECGHSMFTKHDTLNFCPNCGARMDERG